MEIDIVFVKKEESPVNHGKTYTVQMEHIPRIGERVLFDYTERHSSHSEFYDIVENQLKNNMFSVEKVIYPCSVVGEAHGGPTLFLKAV